MSPFRQIALHVTLALVSGLVAAPAVAQTTGTASRAQVSKLWIVAGPPGVSLNATSGSEEYRPAVP